MIRRVRVTALLVAGFLSGVAQAHSGGAAYLSLSTQGDDWVATIDLALPEVATDLALDRDADGAVRWGEVLDGFAAVQARLRWHLQLTQAGEICQLVRTSAPELMRRATGTHLRLTEYHACPQSPSSAPNSALKIDASGWLRDQPDFGVYVTQPSAPGSVVLLAGSATATTLPAKPGTSTLRQALRFLGLGVEHLITGYDHLAFLLLLLLGASRSALQRAASAGLSRSLLVEAAKVVTGFTAAHSLTLALAATGLIHLPSGPVEAAIALSIVLTALGLVLKPDWSPGWRVALAFGLAHGFGFAGLLAELLAGAALAIPLIAFNLGLELAQLLLVALSLPALLWLARRPLWAPKLAPALSLMLAVLGTVWLSERL